MSAPATVAVVSWRDLYGARKGMPAGLLVVLADEEHAGAIMREGDGRWVACRQPRTLAPVRETRHATPEEALRAVLRSGFARHLGARAASPVHWSTSARQAARSAPGPGGPPAPGLNRNNS